MKIGILGGTGRMGSRLARGYIQADHEVILGSRSQDKAKKVAVEIGGHVRGGTLQAAAQEGEIIVLAVGFRDAVETLRTVREGLTDKIVVAWKTGRALIARDHPEGAQGSATGVCSYRVDRSSGRENGEQGGCDVEPFAPGFSRVHLPRAAQLRQRK